MSSSETTSIRVFARVRPTPPILFDTSSSVGILSPSGKYNTNAALLSPKTKQRVVGPAATPGTKVSFSQIIVHFYLISSSLKNAVCLPPPPPPYQPTHPPPSPPSRRLVHLLQCLLARQSLLIVSLQ